MDEVVFFEAKLRTQDSKEHISGPAVALDFMPSDVVKQRPTSKGSPVAF
jgi:hypothetical protein